MSDIENRAHRLLYVNLGVPTPQTVEDLRAVLADWFSLRAVGRDTLEKLRSWANLPVAAGMDLDGLCCDLAEAGFGQSAPSPAEKF